jgi:hypothetical protein
MLACGLHALGAGVRAGALVCLRCTAGEQLDALLTELDGVITAPLVAVRDTLLAAEQPQHPHLACPQPGREILRRLATGELALTHDELDALAQTASLTHPWALLVASGALPERDPHLARLERADHHAAGHV